MLSPETLLQNRYRIVRQLGQGGMGTVYEAVDERLDTTLALKETFFTDERLRKQFEREARLLARLHHPALPRVSDHFTEGDGQFLVMQFISGEDLWQMLEKRVGPFPVEDVLLWADQLLDALDYLHTQEPPIIHRDIKPQNMKLTPRGQIILLDFGLAKGFAGQTSRITGSIFGYTPNYAPLEQIQGTGTDPRSDLYSLGATLYHLVTGTVPPDVLTRLTATTDGQPDPLRLAHEINPRVTVEVASALHRAMAIGRNQRPASAAEMRRMLSDASKSLPTIQEKAATLLKTVASPTILAQEESAARVPPTIRSTDEAARTPVSKQNTAPTQVAHDTSPIGSLPRAVSNALPAVRPKRESFFKLWLLAGFIAVLVAVILVGFASDQSSQTNSNGIATSNRTPIKVGVYADLTGQTSSVGKSTINGIRMAADEINKAGGIGIREIQLVIEDDQGQPSRAATVVAKLINQDRVHAVLGEVASSNTLAAAPTAQEARIPMLAPVATNPRVTQVGDYIFRASYTDTFQGHAAAKFGVNTLKARTAAVLFDANSDYSRGLDQTFTDTFTKLGGRIVVRQSYIDEDQDFRSQLTAIRSANPDVIFVPGYYTQVGVIAKQAKQLNITAPLLGGDGWDAPQLFELGGDALNGAYMVSHFSADDPSPPTQRFVADYRARYDSPPDVFAALAYDAMKLLADAIKRAGSTDSQKVRDAIAQTRSFPGITGNVSINQERSAVKPAVIQKLQGGKFVYQTTIQPD